MTAVLKARPDIGVRGGLGREGGKGKGRMEREDAGWNETEREEKRRNKRGEKRRREMKWKAREGEREGRESKEEKIGEGKGREGEGRMRAADGKGPEEEKLIRRASEVGRVFNSQVGHNGFNSQSRRMS